MLRQKLPTQRLGPHIRWHVLRIHMERFYLSILDVFSVERPLHQGMLVPAELAVMSAQPYSRQVVLIHPSRRRHLISEEGEQVPCPQDVRCYLTHHIVFRLG